MKSTASAQRGWHWVLGLWLWKHWELHPLVKVQERLWCLQPLHGHRLLVHAQPATAAHRGWLHVTKLWPRDRRRLTRKDLPLLSRWQELLVCHLHATRRTSKLGVQPLLQLFQLPCVTLLEL